MNGLGRVRYGDGTEEITSASQLTTFGGDEELTQSTERNVDFSQNTV